jgi:hypothetical protein
MAHTAYFICPDHDEPTGGVRKIYRFVDILNAAGRSATVVHNKAGFRCEWFDNKTPVTAASCVRFSVGDLLVVPEFYGALIPQFAPGVPHLVLNQNAYYTFYTFGGPGLSRDEWEPVVSNDTIGIVTVSENSREYLQFSFPGIPVHRVRNGIDESLFYPPTGGKSQSLSYMPRKRSKDLVQVLRILHQRGVLDGWELIPIDGVTEVEAARLLRSSAVFLALSEQEGFGLPPLEAMASGCVVVGFHGGGGREYFRPEISFPIDDGEIIQFARTAEYVLTSWGQSVALQTLAQNASEFARREYSQEQETRDVSAIFGDALDTVADHAPGVGKLQSRLSYRPRWRIVAGHLRRAAQAAIKHS